MLGLNRNTINLVPHDPQWKIYFLDEKNKLFKNLSNYIISIEHIGSTAIDNLAAKPIIDIAISLNKFEDGLNCIHIMKKLGYLYKGENGIPGRHFFRTDDEIVKFHTHMICINDPNWEKHLKFRDYLINHPEEINKYEKLKYKLKKKFINNREQYTTGKTSFIQDILMKAGCNLLP